MLPHFIHVVCCTICLLSPIQLIGQETAKLDWAKRIGGAGNDRARDIVLDEEGNMYITGLYIGTVDFDPGPGVFNLTSAGSSDIFVLKLDAQGNFIWAKSMGGLHGDTGMGIAIDKEGNVYVTGGFSGTANFDPGPGTFNIVGATTGQHEIFVVKLDNDGNFVWAKAVVGGTWWDNGHKIEVDDAGNVHVIGRFYYQGGPRDFDPGPDTYFLTAGHEDIFILKLDTDGNFMWARNFGTAPHESRGYSLALDEDGNVYATGYFRGTVDFDPGPGTFNLTSVGTWNIFYLKLDANGDFVWAKAMVNSVTNYHSVGDHGRKIIVGTDGNVYITGRFDGTVDFDPGPGVFNLTASGGGYDIYITKLTSDGDFVWAKTMGGSGYDEGFGIKQDKDGYIYVTGVFVNTVDFDPGADVFSLTSAGMSDAFLTKFDSDGNFIWAVSMGGTNEDTSYIVDVNDASELFVIGWFTGTANLDPGPCTVNLVSAGQQDFFIQKLQQVINIPLEINGLSAQSGFIGSSITIQGEGFSSIPEENTVRFFNNIAATVTASTANSITVTVPEGATTGPISVSVNCITVLSADDFEAIPAPVITITTQPDNMAIVCESAEFSVSIQAEGTTNLTYQWQKFNSASDDFEEIADDANISGSNSATLSITANDLNLAGIYRCRVSGDNAADIFTNSISLEITATPAAPDAEDVLSCEASSFELTASGADEGNYRWYDSLTDETVLGTNSSFTTPEINITSSFFVSIVSGVCESERTEVRAIIEIVPTPTISFDDDEVCVGLTSTLVASEGYAGYLWSNAETTREITVSESGNYSVIGFSDSGCESDPSAQISITFIICNNAAPVIQPIPVTTFIGSRVVISLLDIISDEDDNLDLSTLRVINNQTQQGAPTQIDNSFNLIIDYAGRGFTGMDIVSIEVCDLLNACTQQQLTIDLIGDVVVYNAMSPNGDGLNDTLIIQYIDLIEELRENKVTVYNRWGDVVFEVSNYDNINRAFRGLNKNGNELPAGNYFYKIEFKSGLSTKTGFISLKR